MLPTTVRLWHWTVALTAVALYSVLSLYLTGSLIPWSQRGADPAMPGRLNGLARTAPTPTLAALRTNLSQLANRTNVAPGYAEDLAAATAFYVEHGGPLLWVTESAIAERGKAVIGEIRNADDWGLSARDFTLPQPPARAMSREEVAAAEIQLTIAVLQYARYARGGRFNDLSSVSKLLDYTPPLRRPLDVLMGIAASDAPDAYLRSLHPQHPQFEGLRRLLLKLRGRGPVYGRLAFSERLQAALVRSEMPEAEETSSADTGRDSGTVRLGRILVNMERWRWLPENLGEFYIWDNVPEFLLRVIRKGETTHSDRIVAGQPDWATPAFSADMTMIVFHPSWVVPDGIKRKELLPLLRDSSRSDLVGLFTGAQSSRAVLEQHKLQVYYQGRPIDPDRVDWRSANIGAYDFRQPPGPTNVLGAIKFMFPNKHDVYIHDTPERDLFGRSFRGLSHGCMRVADPRRLAAVLLAHDKGWSEQQVESQLNGGTREVELATRIPVHVTYFTAMVDRQGNLRTFGDLYGLDTRMGAILFGKQVPFVTPRYDDEIKATQARHGPVDPSGAPLATLAEAISNIFSP
jgi:murein L,D-transpeptidase YcbB/YkuD